ncbi:MAG: Ig-like domain-containing protein [Alistipes sp.]|jgi:hypothetical protein|nr:Ig-like domain-containing protein [Alistipes sp.]
MLGIYRGITIWTLCGLLGGVGFGCTRTEQIPYTPEVPPTVAVESVAIEPATLELALGDYGTLDVVFTPSNATDKDVSWSSSAPETVSVDEWGRIEGLAVGEATITVVTEDGAQTAACVVTVKQPVSLEVSLKIAAGGEMDEMAGSVTVPFDRAFDNLRAQIIGFDQQPVATAVSVTLADGTIVLELPEALPAGDLCRVARNAWNDYEGFWPAEDVSDRSARVADLGDIIALRGDVPVGRLYLSDMGADGDSGGGDGGDGGGSSGGDDISGRGGVAYVGFHYADRPFTLGGYNLTRPPKENEGVVRKSFHYEASFVVGWNLYANIENGSGPSLVTTTLPDPEAVRWWFEPWP